MSDRQEQKRLAAVRAADFVEDGMLLGLGTGSTASLFVAEVARRLDSGELSGVVGVPTSRETERQAGELGIALTTLEEAGSLDLVVDGADEVDPSLELIKGLGGALLWEKIVASASERMVVIVDEGKLVERLGERSPLPLEVVPFGCGLHLPRLRRLGAEPALRSGADGQPFVTDGGHFLIDCRFPDGIAEPAALEGELRRWPGVVETGLFLGLATEVVVAGREGTTVLQRGTAASASAGADA